MKASSLHDVWASPDNTRLTPKQFSFRLPVHVAAKVAALCEMYPQKSRTQIIADLLTSALDELEQNLPAELGCGPSPEDEYYDRKVAEQAGEEYEPCYQIGGPRGRFRSLSNEHFIELEKELGNDNPQPLFLPIYMAESKFKK